MWDIATAVLLPVLAYWWVSGLAYQAALLWCDENPIIGAEAAVTSASRLQALLVADAHVLGRGRSNLNRAWSNWHLGVAYDHALQYANPDVVLGLGDLLDEGRRFMGAGAQAWDEYAAEASRAFHLRGVDGDDGAVRRGGAGGSPPAYFGSVASVWSLWYCYSCPGCCSWCSCCRRRRWGCFALADGVVSVRVTKASPLAAVVTRCARI
jgi:hypothetical protein